MCRTHGAILGTAHISPEEIVALVTRARELGVEKICVTHPFHKVTNLDLPTLEEVVRLGGMPESAYCSVSPPGKTPRRTRWWRRSHGWAPHAACS